MDLYNLPNVTEPPQPMASSLSIPSILLVTTLMVALISLVYWCVQDYRLYMSLGPGGPPYNIWGWILTSFLVRPFTLAADDTTWTGDYPDFGCHKEIEALPERAGERPVVLGIAPQRQFTQSPGPEMNKRVSSLFATAEQNNSKLLQQRLSAFERHHVALFVHQILLLSNPESLPETAIRSGGEIGHLHGETSLHLYFSPADAKVIIDKGWAERHRCARTQPWWFGWRKYLWSIGDTFLLVYAPRDEAEYDILKTLIRASARFMTGREDIAEP
ncbi:hypothetical protein A1O3_02096 [Capronia epimyces CBS 606.96]|uniref:Luciferase domain-containing protein n=1 Tax=Capronia epimyces CBS 606.96 TaxID=1182542 RepID=W9Y862_9EURO|nr:uncharacterized protein A1O3_02096 [Capronia epimyces CBS 606.96]EXJ89032.1 hypothetical protein A1O3_02096 [Capronia epimyces CBS 606.96]